MSKVGRSSKINQLFPLLQHELSNDISNLATALKEKKIVSRDELHEIEDAKDDQLSVLLSFSQKPDFDSKFLEVLQEKFVHKENLVKFAYIIISKEKNENVCWILESWNRLLQMENTIKNIKKKQLESLGKFSEHWLVDFAYKICLSEDTPMFDDVIKTIKKHLPHLDAPVKTSKMEEEQCQNRSTTTLNADECELEFRAVFADDYKLPDEGKLMLYLYSEGSEECYYPMEYDPVLGIYRFCKNIDRDFTTEEYKFLVSHNDKTIWEELPDFDNDVWNRQSWISKNGSFKQKVILFNVISMEKKDPMQYKISLQQNMIKFLPSLCMIKLDPTDLCLITSEELLMVIEQWLLFRISGVSFVSSNNKQNKKNITHDGFEKDFFLNIVDNEVKDEPWENSSQHSVKRVLGVFVLSIAMLQNGISFKYGPLQIALCKGMSLHDVEKEDLNRLCDELKKLKKSLHKKNDFRTLHAIFLEVLNKLADVPECLLLLPLLKLIENITNASSHNDRPPECSWNDLQKKLKQDTFQSGMKCIAEHVSSVSTNFSWICKLYTEVSSLEGFVNLLNQDNSVAALIDIDVVFSKTCSLWEELNSARDTKEVVDEELAIGIFSFFTEKLKERIQFVDKSRDLSNTDICDAKDWLNKSKTLLTLLIWHLKRRNLVFVSYVPYCLNILDGIVEHSQIVSKKTNSNELSSHTEMLQDDLLRLCNKIALKKDFVSSEMWNMLLSIEWSDEDFLQKWLENACGTLKHIIAKEYKSDTVRLLLYCAENLGKDKHDKNYVECFTDILFKMIEEDLQKEHPFFENPLKFGKNVLQNVGLFKDPLQKMCKRKIDDICEGYPPFRYPRFRFDGPDKFVNFLKHWKPTFLQIICGTGIKNQLPENYVHILSNMEAFMDDFVQKLLSGSIWVSSLHLLFDIKQLFSECYVALKMENKSSRTDKILTAPDVVRLLTLRHTELHQFFPVKTALEQLIEYAASIGKENIGDDFLELKKQIETNVANLPLCRLVECEKLAEDMSSLTATKQRCQVIFFQLREENVSRLKEIQASEALGSKHVKTLMSQIFHEMVNAETAQKISFDEFLEQVWMPTKERLENKVKSIENGSVQLKFFDELAGEVTREHDQVIKRILEEVRLLYNIYSKGISQQTDNKELRIKQISSYFEWKRSYRVAETLKKIRSMLNLVGKFDELYHFLETGCNRNEKQLLSIPSKKSKTEMFNTISENQLETLLKFVECEELIKWLKSNMKNVKEVKVMSDLAMISAGETAMDIDRVSCFNSAVMGFAPLIFETPVKSGFDGLLKACEKVWENVRSDKNLTAKLIETTKQLSWLNFVKSSHGSVESSSLTFVQKINEEGIYEIRSSDGDVPSVENSLRLFNVHHGNGNQFTTLSELRDLQSRLMLIAGEGDERKTDVSQFMNMLASVENLCKAYVKLRLSGCLLFNNWAATIRCKSQAYQTVTVEVFFDAKSPAISSSENAIQEVKNLTNILHEAHTQWMGYLSDKRNKYYHLNHFNIHQLMYLCKALVENNTSDFSDQVYSLLASVTDNVDAERIVTYLDEANMAVEDPEEVLDLSQDEVGISIVERKKRLIKKLVGQEISENVAKAAVEAVESLDEEECIIWALSNQDQAEKIEQEFNENLGYEETERNVEVVQSVVNDGSHLTLQEVINQILNELQDVAVQSVGTVVKTICERYLKRTAVTSLDDCISIQHLGKFLTMLGNSVPSSSLPSRTWPAQFVLGKPNLIVCQQVETIWQTLLSIYMESSDQPLPSASEVLICSQSTSFEEVELLLRRALGTPTDEGQRIYCLVRADELPFKVAKETEEAFQRLVHMSERNDNYRFIIITSSLHHYLTSCFDENKANPCVMDLSVEEYLKRHFCKSITKPSASCVDKGRSCVRVIKSEAAGMGKSLYVTRRCEELSRKFRSWKLTTLRFLEKDVDVDDVITSLISDNNKKKLNLTRGDAIPHLIHIDIASLVCGGINKLLFDLLVLGMIKNSRGVVWRLRSKDFYAIEFTASFQDNETSMKLLNLFPSITCLSPCEVKNYLKEKKNSAQPASNCVLMDKQLLMSEMYQRPYQYLMKFANQQDLDEFVYTEPINNQLECVETLISYCSIKNPSWSELSHFAKFLNVQLHDCEESVFCDHTLVESMGLVGFKQFVVRFMIRMSQDFATPSLNIDDDSDSRTDDENDLFELHQLRRRWESGFHPYLFFNDDRVSMSFVHFNVSRTGALCHPKTNEVVEENLMSNTLFDCLQQNGVNLQQDFDRVERLDKLVTLCRVFGVPQVFDPDPTYELTTDNVLKMLAIHMRFRCGIPVVVMGETGCGKTRMVEFMCKLKAGGKANVKNMVIVKVHGGITVSTIQEKVREAVCLARDNAKNEGVETILFLDEANTTEAIYAIKEAICDRSVHGKKFANPYLQIIAACNPYRVHSIDAIKRMEKVGLGFHVKPEEASEKFAGIPLRHLVYRVMPLPPSMQPLVWDFGQLNNETEAIYIRQMVTKLYENINSTNGLPKLRQEMVEIIIFTLVTSQSFMRKQEEVCSFVSLRDVERTIQCFVWFFKHLVFLNPMIQIEMNKLRPQRDSVLSNVDYALRALIQALGMCYHVTLNNRVEYRNCLSSAIKRVSKRTVSAKEILLEIISCQNVFINAIEVERDIARNEALRENVFMMVMCAEMRIPLFLVGKPGSSKSLAKTIVTDAMQGRTSKSDLFQKLKEIHVLSFQCSAVSDAVGIEAVFEQCAKLQKQRDLDDYVATVVLDEIGLAEDSKKMPLKVLHPLLETASTSSRIYTEPFRKVGFVGISNWALDPAKMNRGIFVTRDVPTQKDLMKTAKAMFQSDKDKINETATVIHEVTKAYMKIYKTQEREFFGLRDYYCLLKMLFHVVSENKKLEFTDVAKAVQRNFNGHSTNALEIFKKHCMNVFSNVNAADISVTTLIQCNLTSKLEGRFLLLLTEQYSAVSLLHKVMGDIQDFQVIFGSSFPHDHDYTEVCRNINRIKVCMESGRAVVLLNLRDLYESLYDALNQHYVTFADQRYIDLGLGGHRVKCRVAKGFRLIVIEEKDVVYNEFPIPLINRLEKYVFEMSSILEPDQVAVVKRLKEWVEDFSKIEVKRYQAKPFSRADAFPAYKDDTPASASISAANLGDDLFEIAQNLLLQTASLDAVCRLPRSSLQHEFDKYMQIYMQEQQHDTLLAKLEEQLQHENQITVFEITSFSQVLSDKDYRQLQELLNLRGKHMMLINLQQFQTEEEYSTRLNEFFENSKKISGKVSESFQAPSFVLLIQCSQAQIHGKLIACAKYSAMNVVKSFKKENADLQCTIVVCFLLTMERLAISQKNNESFKSFHSQDCTSIYIDELRYRTQHIADVSELWNKSVSDVLHNGADAKSSNEALVDIKHLIQESIPEAMAKLTNQIPGLGRNRVHILTELCKNNGFYNNLLQKILFLIDDREKQLEGKDYWIVDEACSPKALQEGGSFRNVLWLRLQYIVACALANIISFADAFDNLDFITSDSNNNNFFVNLWYQVFDSLLVTKLQWSAAPSFVVLSKKNFACKFPFINILYDLLYKEWQLVEELNVEIKSEAFADKIKKTWLQGVLDAAERLGMTAIKHFISDLVHLLYKSRRNNENDHREYDIVQSCVVKQFEAQRKVQRKTHKNAFVEIFTFLMQNRKGFKLLSQVLSVRLDVLDESNGWIEQAEKSDEFSAHQSAFKSLIEKLAEEAKDKFGSIDDCNQWRLCVVQTKEIAGKLLPHADENIHKIWKRIVFVEMFLDQLIPVQATPTQVNRYLVPLSRQARLLWMGSSKIKNMANLKFLKIVMQSLLTCTKDIDVRLLCSWKDVDCKSCRANRFVDPVLLSCGHIICHRCAPKKPGSCCSKCRNPIRNPEALQPLKHSNAQKVELETFKSACTSFFLEYLSTFCYPPFQVSQEWNVYPPDDEVTQALESLVICNETTKPLSPLGNIDTNPTARSYILQLLLRCNDELVQTNLNRHFRKMEDVIQDRLIVMNIFIQCKQDIIQKEFNSFKSNNNDSVGMDFVADLWSDCIAVLQQTNGFNQLEHLDFCARLRFVAEFVASAIRDNAKKGGVPNANERMIGFTTIVCNACARKPRFLVLQQYLIKYLCRRHGMDFFNVLLNNKTLRLLIPQNLIPVQEGDKKFYLESDSLVLSGESYVKTKSLLMDIAQEADIPKVFQPIVHEIEQSPDSIIQILLALSVWRAQGDNENALRETTFNGIIRQLQKYLPRKINQQFFQDIAKRALQTYKLNGATPQIQYKLIELIAVCGSTLLCSENHLLVNLTRLITSPNQFLQAFLPTMPESNFFKVKAVMQQERSHNTSPKAYRCPNGHVYFIGECTNPNQAGICPDCGMAIGGQLHGLLQPGNEVGEITEASQAGYKLGIADNRAPVTPERKLTKLSVCATRICLHIAMLLGSRNGNAIPRMVNFQGDHNNLLQFLLNQVASNLNQLSTCLGRSIDDAFIVMHEIFKRMRLTQDIDRQDCHFGSMNARGAWEEVFQRVYLAPAFSNATNVIQVSQNMLIKAGKWKEKALERLVYELKSDDEVSKRQENEVIPWDFTGLWKYRLRVDIHHLRQTLETIDPTTGAKGAVLKVIVNFKNLNIIQHLYTIISVQSTFITSYQQNIDLKDADEKTLEDYLEENNYYCKNEIISYIEIWNEMRHMLSEVKKYKIPLSYFDDDMDLNSPVSMCLPSKRGRGLCALLMAEYLIEAQNDLLLTCRELIHPSPSFESVNVAEITPIDLVRIEVERDLLPLLIENSQYESVQEENGLRHNITYNLGLLEKKVIEKFLLWKSTIKRETLPMMQYPQDVGFAKDFADAQSNIPQVPLPPKLCQDIDAAVEIAMTSTVCEVVRTLTLVIRFLAKHGEDPNQTIYQYAEKELLLSADKMDMIPRAAQLRHCLALYERLSWHRSKKLIKNGQNPFENIDSEAADINDEKILDDLCEVLKTINIDRLQLELNALLMVCPVMEPHWRLAQDVLLPYLDTKYDDVDNSWCERIPEGILFKNVIHVFIISSKFVNNN